MLRRVFVRTISFFVVLAGLAGTAQAAHHTGHSPAASTEVRSDAYRSAIVIDAATGRVLFEDKADVQNPPASVTKLMTFFIVAEKLKQGELKLDTPVTITAEAARTGGSQVWLVDKEQITVEDLLFALMVHSANDAATALAIQVAGSKEAFVELMNAKARELGMTRTVFQSPHGLPPARGEEPDLSTARDLANLARRLLAETDVLRYSSVRQRDFRHQNGKVIHMTTHNHLLALVPGCDGLKTGYYEKAGYSLVATVQRNGGRIITVILGSSDRKLRDIMTTRLITRGFAALGPAPASAGAVAAGPRPGPASAIAGPTPGPQTPTAGPVPQPAPASGGPQVQPAVGSAGPQAQPATGIGTAPAAQPAAGDSGPAIKAVPLRPEDMLPPENEAPAPEVHVNTSSGGKH